MKARTAWMAAAVVMATYVLLWTCVRPAAFPHRNSDFGCFYRAGRMVLSDSGANIYDLRDQQRFDEQLGMQSFDASGRFVSLPFVFAPFSLVWFAPLASLPYAQAEAVWYAVNVALLLILPLLLQRRLCGWCCLVSAWIVPIVFLPTLLSLLQGQSSVLLTFLFAAVYADLQRGHEFRAGCWLAIATIKPQFALLILLTLIAWRKWKTVWSFVLTAGGLASASIAIVGWEATLSYPMALVHYSALAHNAAGEHPQSMANLRGLLDQLLQEHLTAPTLAAVTIGVSLPIVGAMLVVLRRSRISETSFSLVVVVSVLVSYHAYVHDASLLLLPLLLLSPTTLAELPSKKRITATSCLAAIALVLFVPASLRITASLITVSSVLLGIALAVHVWQERGMAQTSAPTKHRSYDERLLVAS